MGLKDKIFLFLVLAIAVASFIIFDIYGLIMQSRIDFLKDLLIKKQPIYSKGVYVTFRTAGSSRIEEIINLIKNTELNSIVIDIKDYTGRIPFGTDSKLIKEIGSEKIFISDMKELIRKLHKEEIYVIARIAVFEDNYLPRERPDLALKRAGGGLWEDNKGLAWLDPSSKEVWDYVVEIARESAKIGFDEINLDYIRFPSDGETGSIIYPFWDRKTPKKEIIRQFFEYFSQRIKPTGVFISVDLFGLTLTSETDLNIGQWIEDAALYFDYICPMVYPSHYPVGYEGFENPALYPYEVIYKALLTGQERLASGSFSAKLRPWLQDFNLGAIYDGNMIELQKKAVYDAGAFGWLLWNPKNIYTDEGLEKE